MKELSNIEYTVQIWEEKNQYIAYTMPLDVISSGKTPELARKALDEAVHLFLTMTEEIGTLDEVLQEAGYEFIQDKWVSPSWVSVERRSIEIGA